MRDDELRDGGERLCAAAAVGSSETVATLASEYGADAVDASGVPALVLAADGAWIGCCAALLKAGADPDRTGPDGRTPLMAALGSGSDFIAAALLRSGVDLTAEDAEGRSAADWALGSGSFGAFAKIARLGPAGLAARALARRTDDPRLRPGSELLASLVRVVAESEGEELAKEAAPAAKRIRSGL